MMNAEPGEDSSDGREKRRSKRKNNADDQEVTIKEEIKDEPTEATDLDEYCRSKSTTDQIELESDSDDQACSDNDSDWMKKEIKSEYENEAASKKESDVELNNPAIDIDADGQAGRNRDISTTRRKSQRKRNQSNIKVNGRKRILTKKRNMSKGSKKSRAKERKMHKCHLCKYTTLFKSHQTTHIRTHTGEKPFECEICSKAFARKSHLTRHNKSQHSQFEFRCPKCRCGFQNQIDQTDHEDKCHARQFACYLCKYSTLKVSNLKNHMRIHHTGAKPFECSVCFKSFTTKGDLNCHSRVHKKQLPFDCNQCSRRFANENEKQSHEKGCNCRQFECYICKYKGVHKGNLKQHIQSKHTGEKRFECKICDKKFIHKGNLKRHLATHARQRLINP